MEKVQRLHLREPRISPLKTASTGPHGFVKDNTDNQFALVLEVAERARERKSSTSRR